MLANEFGNTYLRWSTAEQWLVAGVIVILFFISVLIHELSHSVTALKKGIPVQGITLFIFGGVSKLEREPHRPMIEFLVAVVGPLTSILLAGILGGLWFLIGHGNSSPEVVLLLLAWTNLTLGLFNLLPGYPLDGGRILRAAIWAITGSQRKATKIAARAGQVVAGLLTAGGVFLAIFVEPINGLWMVFVGVFLFMIAGSSYPRSA